MVRFLEARRAGLRDRVSGLVSGARRASPLLHEIHRLAIPDNITVAGPELVVYATPWTRYPLRPIVPDCSATALQKESPNDRPRFRSRRAPHRRIAPDLERRWREILDHTSFVLGPAVREFESAWASTWAVPRRSASPTAPTRWWSPCAPSTCARATRSWCRRFRSSPPPRRWCWPAARRYSPTSSTATLNLDRPPTRRQRVTARTVGLIGVHLYGRPVRSSTRSLRSAPGTGCGWWRTRRRRRARPGTAAEVGTFGALAAWSFYPSKNLGCFGDGGAITGSDPALLERARRLANHGQVARYQHEEVGTNSRLDSLQAAVLLVPAAAAGWRQRPPPRARLQVSRCAPGPRRPGPPAGSAGGLLRVPPIHHPHRRARPADGPSGQRAASATRSTIRRRCTGCPRWRRTCRRRPTCRSRRRGTRSLSLPMFPELTDAELEACAPRCGVLRRRRSPSGR